MWVIDRPHDMRCNVQHVSSLGVHPSVAGAALRLFVVKDIEWTLTCTCNLHAGLHSSRHAEGACAQDQVCAVPVYCMSAVSLLGDAFSLCDVLAWCGAGCNHRELVMAHHACNRWSPPPWQYRLLAQPGAAYRGFLHSHPCCAH